MGFEDRKIEGEEVINNQEKVTIQEQGVIEETENQRELRGEKEKQAKYESEKQLFNKFGVVNTSDFILTLQKKDFKTAKAWLKYVIAIRNHDPESLPQYNKNWDSWLRDREKDIETYEQLDKDGIEINPRFKEVSRAELREKFGISDTSGFEKAILSGDVDKAEAWFNYVVANKYSFAQYLPTWDSWLADRRNSINKAQDYKRAQASLGVEMERTPREDEKIAEYQFEQDLFEKFKMINTADFLLKLQSGDIKTAQEWLDYIENQEQKNENGDRKGLLSEYKNNWELWLRDRKKDIETYSNLEVVDGEFKYESKTLIFRSKEEMQAELRKEFGIGETKDFQRALRAGDIEKATLWLEYIQNHQESFTQYLPTLDKWILDRKSEIDRFSKLEQGGDLEIMDAVTEKLIKKEKEKFGFWDVEGFKKALETGNKEEIEKAELWLKRMMSIKTEMNESNFSMDNLRKLNAWNDKMNQAIIEAYQKQTL